MRTEMDSSDSVHRGGRSSRVPRACDRCRIRKIKCNGKSQCSRCSLDDAICIYTKRRRPNDKAYSKEYVQLLEEQQTLLVRGLKELYRRSRAGEILPELANTGNEQALIHEVLQTLNVLNSEKDATETDCGSSAGDMTQASSVRSSICEDVFHPESNLVSNTHSPFTPQDLTQSPQVAPIETFDHLMTRFGTDDLNGLTQPPSPTPRATEYTFAEAFSDVYLLGGSEWPKPGLDTFVDPCDPAFTNFQSFHNPYAI